MALALIVVFAGQAFFCSRIKSPVFDEPAHIAAGLAYLETDTFTANRQHPPLLKEISAASLLLGGVHWPTTPDAEKLVQGAPGFEWPVGNSIISTNGPGRVLFWARLPFILLSAMLGVLIYFLGREMMGERAAIGAVFLYTLDPTMLAHSYLVTTDTGVAAFGLLFLMFLWRYVCHPSWKMLLLSGVTLGMALTAKFSAIFLLPLAALFLLASARWPAGPDSRLEHMFASLLGQSQGGAESQSTSAWREYVWGLLAVFIMVVTAILVIQAVYLSPSGLASYVDGLR